MGVGKTRNGKRNGKRNRTENGLKKKVYQLKKSLHWTKQFLPDANCSYIMNRFQYNFPFKLCITLLQHC